MGKCPPGVLCIENVTFLFIISICTSLVVYYYLNKKLKANANIMSYSNDMSINHNIPQQEKYNVELVQPKDIFLNPYMPPLKPTFNMPTRGDIPRTTGDPRGIPINIKTRGVEEQYRQLGILTRKNGRDLMLPLMGRPLYTNRQKWQYYTMNENNNIKLPVSRAGRSCTNEYGCNEIYNGDSVYVEGYKDSFGVTLYENDSPKYIPFV